MAEPRKPTIRCAIYTRKSSEEGLEQDFNSLAAQREACEAYIRSQAHEGWMLIDQHFDDGGFSGGNLDRPALAQLLGLVEKKQVDVIVIYKIDRLTRSLMDFAKLATQFEKAGVSFVSVTQSFNTTDSMGRLMLNVLLSFAQFERELTAERIRDKFAASKRRGMWMGGNVPLGYDVRDRKLIINEAEAKTVRKIFELYLELGTVHTLEDDLKRRGLVTKIAITRTGRATGGQHFTRGHLYKLLGNPLYIGQIRHRTELYKGLHEAIIDKPVWTAVQNLLAGNAQGNRTRPNAKSPSLLAGLIVDEFDNPLSATHAVKEGKRYRYYISRSSAARGSHNQPVSQHRLPAAEVEEAALSRITSFLRAPKQLLDQLQLSSEPPELQSQSTKTAAALAVQLAEGIPAIRRELYLDLMVRVRVVTTALQVGINSTSLRRRLGVDLVSDQLPPAGTIDLPPVSLALRPSAGRIIVAGSPAEPVPALLRAITCGHAWFEDLTSGRAESLTAIATRVGVSPEYVRRIIDLAFLAPNLVQKVLLGESREVSVKNITIDTQLPELWEEHRLVLRLADQ